MKLSHPNTASRARRYRRRAKGQPPYTIGCHRPPHMEDYNAGPKDWVHSTILTYPIEARAKIMGLGNASRHEHQWQGRRLSELSREELEGALVQMADMYRNELERDLGWIQSLRV